MTARMTPAKARRSPCVCQLDGRDRMLFQFGRNRVWTMPTAVLAAMAALQMIGGGEDDAALFIVIKVRGVGGRSDLFTDQCEDLHRVI